MGYVLILFWVVWVVVWVGMARNSSESRPETAASLWPALAGLAIGDLLLIGPALVVGCTGYWWGVPLAGAGFALAIWSRVVLGRSWAGSLTIQEGHRLVRSGPYAVVRHPIYAAMLIAVAGSAVVIGGVALIAPFFTLLALRYKIDVEERQLGAAFPEYQDYRKTTGGLVPRLLRSTNARTG